MSDYFNGRGRTRVINEAIAYTEAIQTTLLSGDPSQSIRSYSLSMLHPLSLGVETTGIATTGPVKHNSIDSRHHRITLYYESLLPFHMGTRFFLGVL